MIISRYITKEIFQTLLAVTFVLMLAFLSQQFVRYLNYVAIGKIPTSILFELVGFEAPYLLALLLPLGLYLGVLLTYGRMHADYELAILRMSGFGHKQLMRQILNISMLVMAIIIVLMLWINPWVSAKRKQLMSSDEATFHLIQTILPGRFQVSPDGRHVMYVEKLSRDHKRAENVFLAQEKKVESGSQPSWALVLADQGYQEKDRQSKDQFFVTDRGFRYEGIVGQNDYKIIQFKKYIVRMPQLNDRLLDQEDEALPISKLWQEYNKPKRAAEFQWRISVAIAALLLALLAIPLSHVKPRKGRFLMLFPAVLIYILYFNLLFIAKHFVEQNTVSTTFGMWWVHGIMMIAIVFLSFLSRQLS